MCLKLEIKQKRRKNRTCERHDQMPIRSNLSTVTQPVDFDHFSRDTALQCETFSACYDIEEMKNSVQTQNVSIWSIVTQTLSCQCTVSVLCRFYWQPITAEPEMSPESLPGQTWLLVPSEGSHYNPWIFLPQHPVALDKKLKSSLFRLMSFSHDYRRLCKMISQNARRRLFIPRVVTTSDLVKSMTQTFDWG